jgi:DNA-binding CsgD family transcriptional regulator
MADDIIDDIYEAGAVPEQWSALLEKLSGRARAYGTILFVAQQEGLRYIASPGLEPMAPGYFERGYQFRDERTRRLFERDHPGFVTDLDVFTLEEWEADPILTEFWRPAGFGWGVATQIKIPTGENIILHSERKRTEGPVEREIVDELDRLRPHLARATLMSARLAFERASGAVTALEAIGLPAAVLDPHGRLFVASETFNTLMPNVFVDRNSGVELADPRANTMFTTAVTAAIGSRRNVPFSIPLRAVDGHPPMIVHVVPVRGAANDVFSRASVVVFVTPGVIADVPTAEVIQGLFDLTPTEARVARALGRGATVAEIATSNGVAQPTVRNQIREIFAKTGVHRQADLVGVLRGVVGPVASADDGD